MSTSDENKIRKIQPADGKLPRQNTSALKFSAALRDWREGQEFFLFITPHDDDAVIGVGMCLSLARQQGIPCRLLVVTDGRNGFTTLQERHTIVSVRKQESLRCYEQLGLAREEIRWLDFPDCGLQLYRGRRSLLPHEAPTESGTIGLQESLVRALREPYIAHSAAPQPRSIPVSRIFVTSATDYHPDHVVVDQELSISIFHAAGEIWPDLGAMLERLPVLYRYPVYRPLEAGNEPNLVIEGSADLFAQKLAALAEFRSQRQIARIVDNLKRGGPLEWLREETFELYSPAQYRYLLGE